MRVVLGRLDAGAIDTNRSVWAVSGMAGAGVHAVHDRAATGKVVVYPQLTELELTPLDDLGKRYPTVAAKLDRGTWSLQAEQELLRVAATDR